MAATKIFNLWAKRSPEWETKYEDTLLKAFCDYGKGSTSYQETRAKLFGAGYELYILAFFIGLYHGQTKDLVADKAKRKDFGWAIENWGTAEARGGRKQYGQIREYMFMALVALTEIDWIALDKGDITPRKVVDLLIDKMEKYANFGFDFMQDKLEDNPDYFYKETAFLQVFLNFMRSSTSENAAAAAAEEEEEEEEAESLD